MAMDERTMILEMLRDGTISVDEAERLLDAAKQDETAEKQSKSLTEYRGGVIAPKRIHVIVTEGGKQKVNIRLPFSLVRAGLNIAKVVGPKYSEEAKALEDVDIDEILEALSDGTIELPYSIVDVDDGDDCVNIVLE